MIVAFAHIDYNCDMQEIIFLNATKSLEVGMLAAVIFRSTSLCGSSTKMPSNSLYMFN